MIKIKRLLLSALLSMAVVCSTLPGQAAETDKDKKPPVTETDKDKKPSAKETDKDKKPPVKVPIVVEGDELYFNDSNGDLFAKGNVVVTQDKAKVMGNLLRGNAKQNEIWIDDNASFTEPGTQLTGIATRYNYGTRTGTMQEASGKVNREFVKGHQIEFQPDEIIIHDGTETGCPAKVPDYHMSADKIEIWPGDKLIAYNAKFWIKDKVIFSMPKYQASLRKGADSYMPRLAYSNADGASITEHLEYPIGDHVSAWADVAYYSIRGWQPSFGVTDQEKNYTLGVVEGHFRDADGNWVKKEPEFNLGFGHQVGSLPVDYTFNASYGKWIDDTNHITSWRQDYVLGLARRPIKLNATTSLSFGASAEHLSWAYNSMAYNTFTYWGLISKAWSPKFSTWAEYVYTQNFVISPMAYNSNPVGRALYTGIAYQIDRMNTVQFIQEYDLALNKPYDQDYYWIRDIHCWTATLEYRAKRKQTILDFTVKRF